MCSIDKLCHVKANETAVLQFYSKRVAVLIAAK